MDHDNVVRFRLIHYYAESINPLTGESGRTERLAYHGQTLHTGNGTETEKDRYNVPQSEIDRLAVAGAFFHPEELVAMGAGVTDDLTAPEHFGDELARGDQGATPMVGSHTGPSAEIHPLSFSEMSLFQVEEYLRTEPDIDGVVEAIAAAGDVQAQEALANKFLTAGRELGWEDDNELMLTLAENAGIASRGPGPDESHAGAGHGISNENDGGQEPSKTDATDGAVKFAGEHGVSLDEVTGTGTGGRVTQPDVQKFVEERNAS